MITVAESTAIHKHIMSEKFVKTFIVYQRALSTKNVTKKAIGIEIVARNDSKLHTKHNTIKNTTRSVEIILTTSSLYKSLTFFPKSLVKKYHKSLYSSLSNSFSILFFASLDAAKTLADPFLLKESSTAKFPAYLVSQSTCQTFICESPSKLVFMVAIVSNGIVFQF
jgi:hypothetical protein